MFRGHDLLADSHMPADDFFRAVLEQTDISRKYVSVVVVAKCGSSYDRRGRSYIGHNHVKMYQFIG
jgi:hypothetical protein